MDDAAHDEARPGGCNPGLKHHRDLTVGASHTALALGSGDVEALGTPAVLALAEAACVDCLVGQLPEEQTSVGTWAEVEHLTAVPLGSTVCAHATLIGHHGTRLEFTVHVELAGDTVARVRHRRMIVERERFLAGLAKRGAAAATV